MTPQDPIRAALERILTAAKLLQQNAEGCAYNHYGYDCELNGLPGWLRDTKADIDAALQAITIQPALSAEVRIKAVLIKVRDELITIMDDISKEEITEALVDAIPSSSLVAPAPDDWNAAIEAALAVTRDNTPAKHEGTLAAHVTGVTIERAIRSLYRGAKESDDETPRDGTIYASVSSKVSPSGRTLDELLKAARNYVMTPEEIYEQKRSWMRDYVSWCAEIDRQLPPIKKEG